MKKVDARWQRPIQKKGKFSIDGGSRAESLLLQTFPSLVRSLITRPSHKDHVKDWCLPQGSLRRIADASVTWIGHATFLIHVDGVSILTDPIFGNISFLFPRLLLSSVTFDCLPHINAVLLSHNHPDHMDAATLYALREKFNEMQYLVPQGDKRWFDVRGFTHTYEHTWWQTHTLQGNNGPVKCTFLPAHHWSQRGVFDKNRSLWGSWMIESYNCTIYFAGDTAYDSHFLTIGKQFSFIDVALMPIGPCEPYDHMRLTHMDASQAVDAFIELGAQVFIPMHWATFAFGTDSFLLPIERLQKSWKKIHYGKLVLPKAGELVEILSSSCAADKTVEYEM